MNGDGNSATGSGAGGGGAYPYRPNSPFMAGDFGSSVHNNSRTKHALGENDFLHSTGATLDAYIAQGQAVLGNLATQRDMLKGASLSSTHSFSPARAHFVLKTEN